MDFIAVKRIIGKEVNDSEHIKQTLLLITKKNLVQSKSHIIFELKKKAGKIPDKKSYHEIDSTNIVNICIFVC